MTEEITEAIRNAFNEYLNAVDKIILENQALQIELQRLEQENKELGRKAFLAEQNARTTASTFCEKDNKIIELEQENKELRAYKDINEDFKKAWDELNEKYKQLRSALEEINILAKNYCNACDEFKAKTYKNKNDCLYCNYGFIKRKINEVLQ